MKSYKHLGFLFTIILACQVLTGCGGSSSGSGSGAGNGNVNVAAGWTTDNSTYVVADTEGNTASLKDGTITIRSSGGNSVTIYYDETTGLPTRAVVGNIIFVYEWDTTNSTVNMAFIDSSGSLSLQRDVSVSASDISAITGLSSSISVGHERLGIKAGFWENVQEDPWWYLGKAAGIVSCGVAVGAAYVSAGTTEIVTAGTFMGATCGMLVVSSAYEATVADELVEGAAGAPVGDILLLGADTAECAGLSAGGCIQAYAGAMDLLTEASDSRSSEMSQEITNATAALRGNGGAIKVTLSWEVEGVDVDLHVIDPASEEIYYSHTTSASGGVLDVDDRDGGTPTSPAVENIYWTSNPPQGTYTVKVVYYSGSGSVNYNIIVYIDDAQYGSTHTGTLTSANPSNAIQVTTFTYPTN